jgi:hypothetical protein
MRKQRRFQPSVGSLEHRLAPSSAMVAVTASASATVDGNFDGRHGDQAGADVPVGGDTGGTARAQADQEGDS